MNEKENVVVENSNEKVSIKRDFAPHRRVSYRICKECGKMYILSDNDAIYYFNKYGNLPLRCSDCREKKYSELEKEDKE